MEGGNQQSWRQIYHTGNLVNPTTGTGTANYISKFTGTTTLGNSVIYEMDGNILIGSTTNRLARLQVVGSAITTETPTLGSGNYYTALFNWSSNTFGLGIHNNTTGRVYIQNQRYDGNTATYDICLQPLGGAVAIGKTSVGSGYVLDTNGSVKVVGALVATGAAAFGKTTVAESGYILDTNGSVKVNGNLVATGDVIAFSSSDRRLKEDIKPIKNALNLVGRLNPVTYRWNKKAQKLFNADVTKNNFGLIAQELAEVIPELTGEMHGGKSMGVNYTPIINILIAAVNELNDRINERNP
jgi:hypothetical protein